MGDEGGVTVKIWRKGNEGWEAKKIRREEKGLEGLEWERKDGAEVSS